MLRVRREGDGVTGRQQGLQWCLLSAVTTLPARKQLWGEVEWSLLAPQVNARVELADIGNRLKRLAKALAQGDTKVRWLETASPEAYCLKPPETKSVQLKALLKEAESWNAITPQLKEADVHHFGTERLRAKRENYAK